MTQELRAISIRQPWAWLIVSGFKDIENRVWKTKRLGRTLIHAAQQYDNDAPTAWIEDLIGQRLPISMERGAIIGEAVITGCVSSHKSPWFFGPQGFVLCNQRQYYNPIPCKGRLSFFVPDVAPSFFDNPALMPRPKTVRLPLKNGAF